MMLLRPISLILYHAMRIRYSGQIVEFYESTVILFYENFDKMLITFYCFHIIIAQSESASVTEHLNLLISGQVK